MKKLTRKVIWMFAIGQLGWSTLSAIVTNWVISFYQPDTEMLEAGQRIFLPQGRVILGLVTILGGSRTCRTAVQTREEEGFLSCAGRLSR